MLTERLEKAREAFLKKDIREAKSAHTEAAIKRHLEEHRRGGRYIGDLVYGALDGIITTFAVVSGVAGASLSSAIVLILGFANLFGDGISMAIGNYLSTKSESDFYKRERSREEWEVENYPKGEIAEIRGVYAKKGFKGKNLDRLVKIITSNKKVWLDTMMSEELGLIEETKTPIKSASSTFFAFVIAGFTPLLPFVLSIAFPSFLAYAFITSIILTFIVLFIVGAFRSYVTHIEWWKSGLEMLIVGGLAAGVAYLVGFLLKGIA
ncbi:MAG TPA: VIT1/CCC1 transporter family protein [Candidatus Nanoarchaeia archaeon]|nr:VIT1/CCC1 transporter family protein [Candidatus Nanoarchaeia archaeon]